jgi:hypothetical protein
MQHFVSSLHGYRLIALVLALAALGAPLFVGIAALLPALFQQFLYGKIHSSVLLPFGFRLDADDDRLRPVRDRDLR